MELKKIVEELKILCDNLNRDNALKIYHLIKENIHNIEFNNEEGSPSKELFIRELEEMKSYSTRSEYSDLDKNKCYAYTTLLINDIEKSIYF